VAGRYLIVRLGSLGDLVHTLPAVSALRTAEPDARIDWLVDAVHRELLDLVPILSSVIALERPSARGWLDVRRQLRHRGYDTAADFQGLIKSAVLARLSGARRVVGFDRAELREPAARFFYTERVAVGPPGHVIDKNLRLAARLGAVAGPPSFPLAPVTSAALEALRGRGVDRFVLLNCGAAWPNKRWPADRFGRLATWIQETYSLPSVVLWGPGEEELAAAAVRASNGAALAAPPTSLTDLIGLSRAASLLVSGDTGPTHIACAVGTPIVALFGPTDPVRNGPWGAGDQSLSKYAGCECHYERRCRRTTAGWCLGTITEDEVKAAIGARLLPRAAETATLPRGTRS
jgi:heptosyltransferase-1